LVFGIKDNGDAKFEITGVENVEKIQVNFFSTLHNEKFNIQLSSKGHILIHRDYFDNTQARMRIFKDRIDTYNAGAALESLEEIIFNEFTAP